MYIIFVCLLVCVYTYVCVCTHVCVCVNICLLVLVWVLSHGLLALRRTTGPIMRVVVRMLLQ